MLDYIIIIYWLLTYLLLFFGFNMSKNNTIMLVAFIHATIITALSSIVLYSYDIQFNRPNMLIEIIISKLSFWYFINDLILLLIFDRDLIYIIHHLCASITLYTTLNMGFGLSSCMLILFLGEITNPFRLAKQMIYEHNKITYSILNFIFYSSNDAPVGIILKSMMINSAAFAGCKNISPFIIFLSIISGVLFVSSIITLNA